MGKIKVGMIGGGIGAFIGESHRRAFRITNQFELVSGVFSSDYEKNKQFAQQEGLDLSRVYPDVQAFVQGELTLSKDQRAEVVILVTPNSLHYQQAIMLMEAGFHVMCEKPMTFTSSEAEDLKRLREEKNLVFALAHGYTGYPLVRQMREMVGAGEVGELQRIDAQYYQGWINPFIHGGTSHLATWRLDPKIAGISSCMGDIGVHAFNLIEYTTGADVVAVLADLNNVKDNVPLDVDGTVLLRFNGNFKGIIRSSQVAVGEENNLSIAIYGSKGGLKWSQEDNNYLTFLREGEAPRLIKPAQPYNTPLAAAGHTQPPGHPEGLYEAFANLYTGMAKAIRGEDYIEAEYPTVSDGVRGMKFLEQVVASHAEGNIWKEIG